MKPTYLRDAIHGDIKIDDQIIDIIDHEYFQRLKNIKQNGLLYLVYPGINHSRFEHSLGAYHIATIWIEHLTENFHEIKNLIQKKECEKFEDGTKIHFDLTRKAYETFQASKKWKLIVQLAALLHDIGHGPLSHTLEELDVFEKTSLITKLKESGTEEVYIDYLGQLKNIGHESFSILYIREIAESFGPPLSNESGDVYCILSLIEKNFFKFCNDRNLLSEEQQVVITWMSPIISGIIDCDKLDYIVRDSSRAGISCGDVDIKRIVSNLFPIICSFEEKLAPGLLARSRNVHTIDHFVISLYELYAQLYYHPKSVEFTFQLQLIVKEILQKKLISKSQFDFSWHKIATDHSFLEQINAACSGLLSAMLKREFKAEKKSVLQLYSGNSIPDCMSQWIQVKRTRPLVKDSTHVFLYDRYADETQNIFDWNRCSLVASNLRNQKYTANIWWENNSFQAALSKLSADGSNENKKNTA